MSPRPGRRLTLAAALLALLAPAAQAQTRPQPQSQAATPVAARPAPSPLPRSYDAGGRRDPFVSLQRSGSDPGRGGAPRPAGVAGLLVAEVALRGVIQSPAGFAGLLQGPDGRTHVVHAGDRLFDGQVRSIGAEAAVLLQRSSDPLVSPREFEVRKPLRQVGEAKR